MRNTRLILSTFLIAGALSMAAQGQIPRPDSGYARVSYNGGPSLNVDVGFFYDELSPYGRWTDHDSYGAVWMPRSVRSDWQPYRLGRWVDSDYGWTWDSDEPFGWATYHYGRWTFDPDYGWIWIPGTVWGPAWVAWQEGGDYVGWAPLPPSVGFQAGVGLRLGGINLSLALLPQSYVYAEQRYFLEPRISSHCLPRWRNDSIFRGTRNITRYGYANQRVVNYGLPVERVERATHRRVQRLRIAEASNRRAVGVRSNELRVFRPPQEKLRTVLVAARNNAGLAVANARPMRKDRLGLTPAPNQRDLRADRANVVERQREAAAQRNRSRSAAELRREQKVRAEKERRALRPRQTAEGNRPDRMIRQEKPLREREATARAQRERGQRNAQQQRSRIEAQRNAQRQAAREQQGQRAAQQRAAREQERRDAQRQAVREQERRSAQRQPARERRPEAQRAPARERRPETVRQNERRGQGSQARPQKPRHKPPGDGNRPPGA